MTERLVFGLPILVVATVWAQKSLTPYVVPSQVRTDLQHHDRALGNRIEAPGKESLILGGNLMQSGRNAETQPLQRRRSPLRSYTWNGSFGGVWHLGPFGETKRRVGSRRGHSGRRGNEEGGMKMKVHVTRCAIAEHDFKRPELSTQSRNQMRISEESRNEMKVQFRSPVAWQHHQTWSWLYSYRGAGTGTTFHAVIQ